MTTLQQSLVDLAELLPGVVKGSATGGSTTTLVDTARAEPDAHWIQGTIFFGSGNNAYKSAKVTNSTSSTGTISFGTQTGACASGDGYTLTLFDRYELVRAINQALQECGSYIDVDSSLTGDNTTTEFTLPDGVADIRRVRVGENINYNWTAVDGTLIFDSAPTSDKLYIFYVAQPGTVTLDADVMPPTMNIIRLKWTAAYYALYNRMMFSGNDAGYLKDAVTMATQQKMTLEQRFPMKLMQPDPKHNGVWD